MGVLRSDLIAHSSLATAGGSVQFDGVDDALKTADDDTYALKINDFTIECWLYSTSDNAYDCWFSNDDYASGTGGIALYKNNSQLTAIVNPSGGQIFDGHGTVSLNTWHHVAFVRQSGNYRYYLNGEIIGESPTQGSYNIAGNSFIIGANNYNNTYPSYEWPGYISNVRVVNGRAVYGPGNFTVPKFKLKNIPGTVLLCCQSSSSTTEAAVGDGALSANSAPVASGFAPFLKEDITDIGPVFGDGAVFDTLSYMVPPGGTTAQSNRGRALIAGGTNGGGWGTKQNAISYIQIQSGGIAKDFGDLSSLRSNVTSVSSSTRAVFGGGSEGASANNAVNTIEYVTIATSSNVTNFGDLTSLRRPRGGVSNNTRGLFGGGYIAPANIAEVDHVTIATTGDATDFGDLSVSGEPNEGSSNSTRGVWMGGGWGAQIEYVTIASTGSGADFGNVQNNRVNGASASSSTRALLAGGGTAENAITYITIATLGNDTDFGDLTVGRRTQHGTSNGIRGIFCGGYTPDYDIIDSVIIATTGNAVNYGDLTTALREPDACSDSHGGIA